jgi:hypothetical protein
MISFLEKKVIESKRIFYFIIYYMIWFVT